MERSRCGHGEVAAGSGEMHDSLAASTSGAKARGGHATRVSYSTARLAACYVQLPNCGEVTWREAVLSPGGMRARLHRGYADDQVA